MTNGEKKTILVVEDSENLRRLLVYNLQRAGYEVLQAGDGKAAVHTLQSTIPDLILLDVRMPEMNGFQLLELMRRYPRAAAIPVIMLTALSQADNIDRALALGVYDYLVKPLEPTALLAKIEGALSWAPQTEGDKEQPERREQRRVKVSGIGLDPQPGGTCLDIGEGGMAWRTKTPPDPGDVMVVSAEDLFDALTMKCDSLRVRVAYVVPIGLGYHRVGGAFIGLSEEMRDAVRRFVIAKVREEDGASETDEAP